MSTQIVTSSNRYAYPALRFVSEHQFTPPKHRGGAMRIKSDQCDYDMEYGAFGDTVPCGASTTKCEHCLTDAAVCEPHLFECRVSDCNFKGCYDCVETHETAHVATLLSEAAAVLKQQPKMDWLGIAEGLARSAR